MARWTVGAVLLAAVLLSGCRRGSSSGSFLPATSGPGTLLVIDTVPRPDAEGVPVDRSVGVAFSAAIDAETVTSESFQLFRADEAIEGELTVRGREIFFAPEKPLLEQQSFEVLVSDAIRGGEGESLAEPVRFRFRTGSAEPFDVARLLPPDGARSVAPNVVVTAELTLDVDPSSIDEDTLIVRRGSQTLSGSLTVEGSVLELRLDDPLQSETSYTASLAGTVADESGRPLGEDRLWSFTTRETIPPTVTSTFPEADGEEVDRRVTVEATFSEDLAGGTVDESSFVLQRPDGVKLAATVSYADRRATLSPTNRLLPSTVYTARLSDHITDTVGNPLETFEWSFTTEFDQVGPADLIEADDSGDAAEPHVVVIGEERAQAVWSQRVASSAGGDDQMSIYSRYYDFTAGHWDPQGPVLLDRWEERDCHSPDIARDPESGDAIAVWLQEVEPDVLVWPMARRFDGAKQQWEDVETHLADTKGVRADSLRIAFDGERQALAVWRDQYKDTSTLWARRYAQGGWEKPRPLSSSDAATSVRNPVVAGSPRGGFFIAWESVSPKGLSDLVWTRFGEDWGKPEPLESDERQAYGVSIAFTPGGDAFFVWHQNNTRDDADVPIADVRSRTWLVQSGGFETEEPLYVDVDAATARSAVLSTDADGGALVAWIQAVADPGDAGPEDRVLGRRFDPGDRRWGPASPWRLDDSESGAPSNVAITQRRDGAAWVVWNEPGPKGQTSLVGAHFDVTGFWHESAFLQADLEETSAAAALAVGVKGAAFVTWPETTGPVTSIWAVRFP